MNAAAEIFEDDAHAANECLICGVEVWSCIFEPTRPYRRPTPEQIQRARNERLMRAERKAGDAEL